MDNEINTESSESTGKGNIFFVKITLYNINHLFGFRGFEKVMHKLQETGGEGGRTARYMIIMQHSSIWLLIQDVNYRVRAETTHKTEQNGG